MVNALTEIGGQIIGGIIFWAIIIIVLYFVFYYESTEEKNNQKIKLKREEDNIRIKKQEEIESRNKLLQIQQNIKNLKISAYMNMKQKADTFDDIEIVTFMNQNIKHYNDWIKLDEEITKEKSIDRFETSKFIIYSDYHSTSDTLCRYLKNKETGIILKKWCYGYD